MSASSLACAVCLAALCEYLGAFADHFGLRQHLRCNTRLVQLERRSDSDTGLSQASILCRRVCFTSEACEDA